MNGSPPRSECHLAGHGGRLAATSVPLFWDAFGTATGRDSGRISVVPSVNLDRCLRGGGARRENLGGDGHRRTFIRSTPAERSEGEGGRTLWPVELRCDCRRGWGTRAVAEGAKS